MYTQVAFLFINIMSLELVVSTCCSVDTTVSSIWLNECLKELYAAKNISSSSEAGVFASHPHMSHKNLRKRAGKPGLDMSRSNMTQNLFSWKY